MSDYLVQFNNISKFFGKVIALKDVIMKLRKTLIVALSAMMLASFAVACGEDPTPTPMPRPTATPATCSPVPRSLTRSSSSDGRRTATGTTCRRTRRGATGAAQRPARERTGPARSVISTALFNTPREGVARSFRSRESP